MSWRMRGVNLLMASILGVLLYSCSSRPEYGISLDTQHLDIGTVYLDSAVRNFNVGFTNTGKKDLIITEVKTDCDCTTATFSPEPVSSGDKGEISITLNLSTFFPQEIKKTVAVYSNATKYPVMIDIKGNVKRK